MKSIMFGAEGVARSFIGKKHGEVITTLRLVNPQPTQIDTMSFMYNGMFCSFTEMLTMFPLGSIGDVLFVKEPVYMVLAETPYYLADGRNVTDKVAKMLIERFGTQDGTVITPNRMPRFAARFECEIVNIGMIKWYGAEIEYNEIVPVYRWVWSVDFTFRSASYEDGKD